MKEALSEVAPHLLNFVKLQQNYLSSFCSMILMLKNLTFDWPRSTRQRQLIKLEGRGCYFSDQVMWKNYAWSKFLPHIYNKRCPANKEDGLTDLNDLRSCRNCVGLLDDTAILNLGKDKARIIRLPMYIFSSSFLFGWVAVGLKLLD